MQSSTLILFLAISGVSVRWSQADCPPGMEERVLQCVRGMQAFTAATTPQEHRQACSSARAGIACVRTEMGTCDDIDGTAIAQLESGLTHLEGQLGTICGPPEGIPQGIPTTPSPPGRPGQGNRGRCTSGIMRKMRRCATMLQRATTRSPVRCRTVTKAMACLDETMERCRHNIEAGFESGLQPLRDHLSSICENVIPETVTEAVTTPQVVIEGEDCPPDFQQRIMTCVESVSEMDEATQADTAEMCRVANGGFDCVSDYLERCADRPEVAQMNRIINMDTSRAYIQQHCAAAAAGGEVTDTPVGPGTAHENCPVDYQAQLEACVEPLNEMEVVMRQQGVSAACRRMEEAFECISEIVQNCGDTPEIQAFLRMMNVEEMENAVRPVCPGINLSLTGGTPAPTAAPQPGTGQCPPNYAQRLQTCVQPMRNMQTIMRSRGLQEACRQAEGSILCVEDIIDRCGHTEEVTTFQNLMDLDQVRNVLSGTCPNIQGTGGNGLGPVVEPSGNCPSNYQSRLRSCMGPLQNLQQIMRSSGLARACSVLEDGIECLEEMIRDCPSKPEVRALSQVLNVNQLRGTMGQMCSKRRRSLFPGIF